jgi:hypothetical protein
MSSNQIVNLGVHQTKRSELEYPEKTTDLPEVTDKLYHIMFQGRCGRDRMVVGFTTTYEITAYHH